MKRAGEAADTTGKKIKKAGEEGAFGFAKIGGIALKLAAPLLAVGALIGPLKRVGAGILENIGLTQWWNREQEQAIRTWSKVLGATPAPRDLGIGALAKEAEKARMSLALLQHAEEDATRAAAEAGQPLDAIVVALRKMVEEGKKTASISAHTLALARNLNITAEDAKKLAAAYQDVNKASSDTAAAKAQAENLREGALHLEKIGASFEMVEKATRDAAVAQELYNQLMKGLPVADATRAAEKLGTEIDVANDKARQAKEAFEYGYENAKNAIEEVDEAGRELAQGLESYFRGIFDSIRDGAFTAADALRSLLDMAFNVVANLASQGLASGIGSLFNFGGARAHGGDVSPGSSYLVGEDGPELFQPGRYGTVFPLAQSSTTNAPVFNIPVTVNMQGGSGNSHRDGEAVARMVQEKILHLIEHNMAIRKAIGAAS